MLVCMIGDLHFGEKGNSQKYNEQVLELLKFAKSESEKRGCETVFQFGDYFDNRSKIDVSTLHYGIEGAKFMRDNFTHAYTIVSNHDIYHRDRLDITSMKVLEPYITVIDEPTILWDNVLATPWIVHGEMWDKVVKMSRNNRDVHYMFAHLELNGFMVNDAYKMEHGHSPKELRHLDHVYTGHYHSPQTQNNITYLGTPLPITMNEANEAHGIYFFDTESGKCDFIEYDKVKVISVQYDKLDELEDFDPENTYIRVEFPDDLEDETLISDVQEVLKEMNVSEYKIKYSGQKAKQIMEADVDNVEEVENIDAVVQNFLSNSTEIEGIDKTLLGELYNKAKQGDNV